MNISEIKKIIVNINSLEKSVFGGGLLSIFKPKNFSELHHIISSYIDEIIIHRELVEAEKNSGKSVNLDLWFMQELEDAAKKMAHIANRLSQKSNNIKIYSMDEYKSDYQDFIILKNGYEILLAKIDGKS